MDEQPTKRQKTLNAAILLFQLLLAGTTRLNAAELASLLAPGNHSITIKHGGRERSAIVRVPPRAAEKRELAVVLNFHGGGPAPHRP